MQMLRDQHNTDTYDLHPHKLSWNWIPWTDQPTWLRNAIQLQPRNFMYRSGSCMRQCLRGSRDLQLRLSLAQVCCWAVQGISKQAHNKCKASFPMQERCLLQHFTPESTHGMPAALRPSSGTPFARFFLSIVRNSFSFLSLLEGQNCVPRGAFQFTGLWTLTVQRS